MKGFSDFVHIKGDTPNTRWLFKRFNPVNTLERNVCVWHRQQTVALCHRRESARELHAQCNFWGCGTSKFFLENVGSQFSVSERTQTAKRAISSVLVQTVILSKLAKRHSSYFYQRSSRLMHSRTPCFSRMESTTVCSRCQRSRGKGLTTTLATVIVVFIYLIHSVRSGITPPTFIAWNETQFVLNHMVLDPATGTIYLGGMDRLWKLDQNLNVLETIMTGPVEDDPSCVAPFATPTQQCQDGKRDNFIHNYNKILAFDPDHKILITCGSVRQGTCEVRRTDTPLLSSDVTVYDSSRSYYLAANSHDKSTVSFIAPGPPNPELTNVLYVGVSYSGNFEKRNFVPAVSSRQLTPGDNRLEYASYDTKSDYGTLIEVNGRETREEYPIQYVAGFNDTGYSYFLTIQKTWNGDNPTSNYISKIIQICHGDKTYSSYVEIPIECSSPDGSSYNLVQAATIGTPGVDLAAKLGISSDKKILIASFSKGEPVPNNNVPQEMAAICVYKMTDVRRKFLDNVEACYRGGNNLARHFTSGNCLSLVCPEIWGGGV